MPTRNDSTILGANDTVNAISGKRIRHTRVIDIMSELDTLIYPESQDRAVPGCAHSRVFRRMRVTPDLTVSPSASSQSSSVAARKLTKLSPLLQGLSEDSCESSNN